MSKVALVVTLTLTDTEARDRFLPRAKQHAKACLAEEEGCLQFDILVPTEGKDQVLLYEVYADQAAVDVHLNTPRMKAYLEETGPLISDRRRRVCHLQDD